MTMTMQEAERLVREGAVALQAGRAALARRHFEAVTATGRANVQIWAMLALACKQTGDPVAEEEALDALLALDPKVVRALVMKGDVRADAGGKSAAIRLYKEAIEAAAGQNLPSDLLAELGRAETMVHRLGDELVAELEDRLAAAGLTAGPRSARFQHSVELMAGKRRIYLQEPTAYYFPELPQVQYYDSADFAWVPAVEAATDSIRKELEAVLAADGLARFRPYMDSHIHGGANPNGALIDSYDWSTLFLVENGARDEAMIARCPRTWDAVQWAPLPDVAGIGPTVMFSLLKPGARIAPHTGMYNTRLICHLPLIVPPGCTFRVGNDVRAWEAGKLLIFDDTVEHEARNDGAEDRVVLIFDIWRPEISEQERTEVSALLTSQAAR